MKYMVYEIRTGQQIGQYTASAPTEALGLLQSQPHYEYSVEGTQSTTYPYRHTIEQYRAVALYGDGPVYRLSDEDARELTMIQFRHRVRSVLERNDINGHAWDFGLDNGLIGVRGWDSEIAPTEWSAYQAARNQGYDSLTAWLKRGAFFHG